MVAHSALFGSTARGEEQADSDIDILVELQPLAKFGLIKYVGIVQLLEDMVPGRVDVANRAGLKSVVRQDVERDALNAF